MGNKGTGAENRVRSYCRKPAGIPGTKAKMKSTEKMKPVCIVSLFFVILLAVIGFACVSVAPTTESTASPEEKLQSLPAEEKEVLKEHTATCGKCFNEWNTTARGRKMCAACLLESEATRR